MNTTPSTDSITVRINGQSTDVKPGTTVLEAAQQLGLSIPTLCTHPSLPALGACRLCLVEIEDDDLLQPACSYPLTESVSLRTHSPRVLASRRMTMELLMARCMHNTEPYTGQETFHHLAHELGIRQPRFTPLVPAGTTDASSPAVLFNPNACIQCGLCVTVCNDMQQVYAINIDGRSIQQSIQPGLHQHLGETECNACGQCTTVCPTGAFVEQDHVPEVIAALADPTKFVIAAVFPAVGTAVGLEYGISSGTDLIAPLVNGLKKTGFDMVFNAGFGHDLVAMETAFELRERLVTGERLPLIISSCPPLVKYIEHLYPSLIPNLSVNKSPAQMFGRVLKTYYAERLERAASDIVVVQITSCLASKFERTRHELDGVDIAITSREAIRLLRTASGYDLSTLEGVPFDTPFGEVSGAGILSDVTGGTMEAVLRTICELKAGMKLDELEFEGIRGMDPIRETDITVGEDRLRVSVAHDLGHGNEVLQRIQAGRTPYHLIEIMACPGGCVGGGGQPVPSDPETIQQAAESLIRIDRGSVMRKPRQNTALNHLYAEFLKAPFGEKSEEILQTVYSERGRY